MLARGLPVAGPDVTGPVISPLTFTFEAGHTYLVGIYDQSASATLPFKDLGPDGVGLVTDTPPRTVSGLTIGAVRSSRPLASSVHGRAPTPTDANELPLVDLAPPRPTPPRPTAR